MATINSYATGVAAGILTPGASARRFAYIDTRANYAVKEPHINSAFNDSLIVIGDEERAFIPVLNSYIGPNKKDIDYLIKKTSDLLVTSINGMVKDNYITGSNLNKPTELIDFNYSATNPDLTNNHSKDGLFGTNGLLRGDASGIEVYSYITYTWSDGSKQSIASNHSDFTTSVSYYKEHSDYFIGAYTAISDAKTIKYVQKAATGAIAYSAQFTKEWTNNQINKLYSEIVGIEYIPVDFDAEDGITGVGTERYIHTEYASANYYNTATSGEGSYLTYNVSIDAQYLTIANSATNVPTTVDLSSTNPLHYNILYAKISSGTNIADINYTDVGDLKIERGTLKIDTDTKGNKTATVTIPSNPTAGSGNMTIVVPISNVVWGKNTSKASNLSNIKGAITTISKVADILDKITDGAKDGGVSLAYSIADNRLDIEALSYKVESLISPTKGPDNTIYNVNTLQTKNNSNFVALTLANGLEGTTDGYYKGFIDSEDSTWKDTNGIIRNVSYSSSQKGGDLTLTLSTKLGSFDGSLSSTTGKTEHKTIAKFHSYTWSSLGVTDGLATTSDVASYVATAAKEIIGSAVYYSYTMIASLDMTFDVGDSTSDLTQIKIVDKVAQHDGLISAEHRNIKLASNLKENADWNYTIAGAAPVTAEISSKTASDTTITVNTYTGTLEYYAAHKDDIRKTEGQTGAKNLATVGNIYSYIMNLVSWVDLSDATVA